MSIVCVIRPVIGLVLIVLAEGIRGVAGESGIEFNATHDQVAEAAVQVNRPDILPLLRRFEDGAFVQYTPQGRRVDTEVTADNIRDIFASIDDQLYAGVFGDEKTLSLAVEAGLVARPTAADDEFYEFIDRKNAELSAASDPSADDKPADGAEVAHTDASIDSNETSGAEETAENTTPQA